MAPMSGRELLERMRADERLGATPFVLVANDNDDFAAGASSTIIKPFSAQTLKAKLEPLIGAF
jgi:two-component system chemotaxis response regulator CheY